MIERFSHVMMYCGDLDRAVAWYTDKLGMKAVHVNPGSYASMVHEASGFRIDLHTVAGGPKCEKGPIVNFLVKDIAAAVETLRSRGVDMGTPDCESGKLRYVTFQDSEGNWLGLTVDRGR